MDHVVDAKNKRLGRIASEIAIILQGKKSAKYEPRLVGDRVLVKNFSGFTVTGRKLTQKLYHRHTGYMGHLKTKRLEEVIAQDPRKVLREAVRKMLPKNFLNQRRLNNLIFVGDKKAE